MAGTVVGVFKYKDQALQAAEALLADQVPIADISLVCKDAGGQTGSPDVEGNAPAQNHEEAVTHTFREVPIHDVEQPISPAEEIAPRATAGVVAGVPMGALLVSLAVIIPGVGPLLAAGPIVAMLAGGITGGVIGGLVGGLTSGGIPEESAQAYHDHVTQGDTLVTILSSEEKAPHMEEILRQHGGQETAFFKRFLDSVQSIESPSHSA